MSERSLKILEDLLGANKSKGKRFTELLREPEDNFTQWYMCIPKCFNDALDIKRTARVVKKQEKLEWTQGASFSFKVGDIIYDVPEGYTLPWSEALQKIKTAIQITQMADTTQSNQTASKSEIVFDVFVPNKTKTGLEIKAQHRIPPDIFVKFLIIGPVVLSGMVSPT